jgi:hypothetical protein
MIRYKKNFIFQIAILIFSFSGLKPLYSQSKKDSLFLNYLVESSQNREIITFLNQLQLSDTARFHTRNNLYFKKGMAFYNIKSLDSASAIFSKINLKNPNYIEAKFFEGISNCYLNKFDAAKNVFLNLETSDSLLIATRNFELAGLSLIQRDFKSFDKLTSNFSEKYYQISKQQASLLDHKTKIQKFQRKSPLKAGILSALLPGLGKLYVGQQLGQGISTFIQNAVFGIQTIEAYRKAGPKSARFIIYGSLFSVFYVGNIWGSALSVSIKRQEFNEKINDQILFDMHIPLRTLFN